MNLLRHSSVIMLSGPELFADTQADYAGWTSQPAPPQSPEEPRKFFNETSYAGLQHGQPMPVVQGMQAGPMSTEQALFCPATQDGPAFLGATVGHHPIPIHCGACGYQGLSHVTWGLFSDPALLTPFCYLDDAQPRMILPKLTCGLCCDSEYVDSNSSGLCNSMS